MAIINGWFKGAVLTLLCAVIVIGAAVWTAVRRAAISNDIARAAAVKVLGDALSDRAEENRRMLAAIDSLRAYWKAQDADTGW